MGWTRNRSCHNNFRKNDSQETPARQRVSGPKEQGERQALHLKLPLLENVGRRTMQPEAPCRNVHRAVGRQLPLRRLRSRAKLRERKRRREEREGGAQLLDSPARKRRGHKRTCLRVPLGHLASEAAKALRDIIAARAVTHRAAACGGLDHLADEAVRRRVAETVPEAHTHTVPSGHRSVALWALGVQWAIR